MIGKWEWRPRDVKTTYTSTFSGTTTGIRTASITTTTLGEGANAGADVVAEDAFIARVRHDCFELCWDVDGGCENNNINVGS